MNSPPVGFIGQQQHRNRNEQIEPVSLVKMRTQTKIKRRVLLTPHTIVVTRHHAKGVTPGRNIRVVRNPPRPGIDPVAIEAIELIAESNLLRRNKTQSGILKSKARMSRPDLCILHWQPR